jgi:hypothetical protein
VVHGGVWAEPQHVAGQERQVTRVRRSESLSEASEEVLQGALGLSVYKARNEMLTLNRKTCGKVDTKAYFHEPLEGCL